MIVRFLLAAIAAGLFSGFMMTAAQSVKVVPLILEAENYEIGTAHSHGDAVASSGNQDSAHDHDDGTILFGLSRLGGTLLANLVLGTGFALIMAAMINFAGPQISYGNAFLWGLFGWMAVQLLPSLGTPPELPGMPTADLDTRKIWWTVTVVASAIGLWLFVTKANVILKIVGGVLVGLPHIIGAPRPENLISDVPAHLASEYAVAALTTTLFFWVVLAFSLVWFRDRFGSQD